MTTATVAPPLTCPRLGGHFHSCVFEAVRGISRNHIETPGLLPGFRIVCGDITPVTTKFRTAMTNQHFAFKGFGCACDVARFIQRERTGGPDELTRGPFQGK